MKAWIFIFSLFLLGTAHAQVIFNITYERPGYEFVSGLVQDTSNYDFIISGTSGSYPDDVNSQALLLRIDTNGVVVWRKYFGTPETDNGKNVIIADNGDLVFCGYSDGNNANDYDMFVTRTDNDGNELWTRFYGGESWDLANYIDTTGDGGLILVGETFSYGNGQRDAYILRLNAAGDTLWTRTFGFAGDDSFTCVRSTNDGGFVATGYVENVQEGHSDAVIVKWNNLGDTLWTLTLGGSEDDVGNFVEERLNGEILFAGTSKSEAASNGTSDRMHYRLDANGQVLFFLHDAFFADALLNETAEIIRETADNGFASFGTSANNQDIQQVLLGRMNDQCIGSFDRLCGTQPFFKEEIGGAIITHDGGYAIAGHTDFGEGPSNVFLIRTTINPICIFDGIIGIADLIEDEGVEIYPNPATDHVTVLIPQNLLSVKGRYNVLDAYGRVCLEGPVGPLPKSQIDLTGLVSGSYFLVIDVEDGRILRKLLKF